MRKQSIGLESIDDDRPRRRLPRRIVGVLIVATAAPFLYELAALCVGNWRAAMGMSSVVRTPVLDASREVLEHVRDEFLGMIPGAFQHIPWDPSYVLLVAAVAMTASMRMLRR